MVDSLWPAHWGAWGSTYTTTRVKTLGKTLEQPEVFCVLPGSSRRPLAAKVQALHYGQLAIGAVTQLQWVEVVRLFLFTSQLGRMHL